MLKMIINKESYLKFLSIIEFKIMFSKFHKFAPQIKKAKNKIKLKIKLRSIKNESYEK